MDLNTALLWGEGEWMDGTRDLARYCIQVVLFYASIVSATAIGVANAMQAACECLQVT